MSYDNLNKSFKFKKFLEDMEFNFNYPYSGRLFDFCYNLDLYMKDMVNDKAEISDIDNIGMSYYDISPEGKKRFYLLVYLNSTILYQVNHNGYNERGITIFGITFFIKFICADSVYKEIKNNYPDFIDFLQSIKYPKEYNGFSLEDKLMLFKFAAIQSLNTNYKFTSIKVSSIKLIKINDIRDYPTDQAIHVLIYLDMSLATNECQREKELISKGIIKTSFYSHPIDRVLMATYLNYNLLENVLNNMNTSKVKIY